MGEEPRIAAAWLDSVYADIITSIEDRLTQTGYPSILVHGGLLVARLHGDDLTAYSPLEAAASIGVRNILITHSDGDPTLPVRYASRLANALRQGGTNVELWITNGDGHVRSMFEQTEDYEQRLTEFFNNTLQG
jgi:dipeptidyl aminopeptidase/acylaminoacyl peptidase